MKAKKKEIQKLRTCSIHKSKLKLTWCNNEDIGTETTEHVRNTILNSAGKSSLFEGRKLVGYNIVNLGKVAEVLTVQLRGKTHLVICTLTKMKFIFI